MGGASARILVLDDDPGFRELSLDLLAEAGYAAEGAATAVDALAKVERGGFQLVLSDIVMPGMDGIAFLKTVKQRVPGLDVILMTTHAQLHSALDALRFGAYDYVSKPLARDGFLATVRRCLEKQRLTGELRKVQDELIKKEKLAALGTVSAWLAHRMRNPLNVILMCTQYLRTHFPPNDERREVASVIEEKVKSLERMTKDFIGFSRTYEPRFHPEDLHALINEVLEIRSARHAMQKVTVEKRYEDPLPLVSLDKELMSETLGYLFDNAVEAMGGEGRLEIHIGRATDRVFIDVSNTGTVIPADVRRRLFEPFFTTKERGTGLGLAIARKVVESHGGEIALLETEITTFRLSMPVGTSA